jgi:hypothetical protein
VDGGNSLPLDTLAPDAWINRWFDRRTWDGMTAIRSTLHAPIACIDFSTFNLLMECDGRAVEELDSGNNRVLTNKEREPGYRITPRHTHTIPPWNPTELAEKYRNYWYWLRESLRQHGTLPNRYKQPHGNASDLRIHPRCRFSHLEPEEDIDFEDVEKAAHLKTSEKCAHSSLWRPKKPTKPSAVPFSQHTFDLQYPEMKRLQHTTRPITAVKIMQAKPSKVALRKKRWIASGRRMTLRDNLEDIAEVMDLTRLLRGLTLGP